jgi:ribosome-associated toxin RatA of RatAB toxin-antitoxin module
MDQTSIHRASRSIDVLVPAGAFMEVVCDFAHYPDFVSSVLSAQVEAAWESSWRVAFEVVLFRRRLQYTLNLRQEGDDKLTWELVRGDWMSRNHGQWTLSAIDARSTRAIYTIEVAIEGILPHAVTSLLMDASIPRLLRDFKRRAEVLVGSGAAQ